ncbi:hypothetical protein DFH07DRAFT_955700 [Mycena maculata]|uniref:Uncharacterized protein n=1 Tax=Mycena maculata TaxID=230809 RepID=A0AAD7NLT3_9AGAR|nr:hypothetical protein DFH07DRAFT_955700 [Mycena maculata]
MRFWVVLAACLLFETPPEHGRIPGTSSAAPAPEKAANSAKTLIQAASTRTETPSPHHAEQPSLGPNAEFLPTPKKRGWPAASVKNKHRKLAEEEAQHTDQEISRQASRLLSDHGTDFLDLLHAKRPDVLLKWALKTSLPVIAAKGKNPAELLRPDVAQTYTSRLKTWSLEKMISEAMITAPNLCELLILMGMSSDVGRQDNKLVLVTVLCMLAQSQNEHATQFQEIMGTYFLACSTPRPINDLKGLSAEGLARLRHMVQEKACMIVWDNLNIAFKVSEQRHNSKDSFENGTTGTLILLYSVLRGELEFELLEPRLSRKPVIDLS